jgi:hypothetical protein
MLGRASLLSDSEALGEDDVMSAGFMQCWREGEMLLDRTDAGKKCLGM